MSNVILTYAQGLDRDNCHQAFLQSVEKKVPSARLVICKASTEKGQVVHTRWRPMLEALEQLDDSTWVIISDSRDLVFNWDPFERLKELGDLLFFSEGQNTGDHSWCVRQHNLLMRHTPRRRMHKINTPEVNGGFMFGTASRLREVAAFMSQESLKFATTPVSDQPVLNHWVKTKGYKIISDKSLYAHGELVRMNRWKANPLEAAAYHQFDRVPEHRAHYIKQLGVSTDNIQKVVSRYNEPANAWKLVMPDIADAVVYCKGPNPEPGEIVLPNVGYEAHTWLHHFHENYDALPPITLCLQGDPKPHCRVKHDHVEYLLRDAHPDRFWYMPFTLHGDWQDHFGNPHHGNLNELRNLWEDLLGYPCPSLFHSYYGGQFAVSREAVRSRPRELYARARDLIITKNDACAMERMWYNWFCH